MSLFRLVSKGLHEYTGYKVSVDYKKAREAINQKNKLTKEFKKWNHTVEVYPDETMESD